MNNIYAHASLIQILIIRVTSYEMYGSLGLLGPLELLGLLGIFNTEVTPDWINNDITRVEKRPEVFTHICSLQSKHSMHSAFDLEPDLTSVPESPKIEDIVQTKKQKSQNMKKRL